MTRGGAPAGSRAGNARWRKVRTRAASGAGWVAGGESPSGRCPASPAGDPTSPAGDPTSPGWDMELPGEAQVRCCTRTGRGPVRRPVWVGALGAGLVSCGTSARAPVRPRTGARCTACGGPAGATRTDAGPGSGTETGEPPTVRAAGSAGDTAARACGVSAAAVMTTGIAGAEADRCRTASPSVLARGAASPRFGAGWVAEERCTARGPVPAGIGAPSPAPRRTTSDFV